MRIATWNIGGGFIYSDQSQEFNLEKIEYFIDELKAINPDIVCFQEAHVSENNDQPAIIAESLNFEYIVTEQMTDSHLKDGEKLSVSIISRYPIISYKFNKLSNPNLEFIWKGEKVLSHDKGFLEAKIDYKSEMGKILSGHMFPFRKFGKNLLDVEFKGIREEIENIVCDDKIPEIICADMNFEGDICKSLPRISKQGFSSILGDYPTTPRDRKYDKIIISNHWLCGESNIIKGRADHYLCFADVELKI